ncbi:transient receptor potential cation channel subfamily A member 1-like [Chenopodium quinoa]|uniref:Uncharacterized protein n=1 Tax=Chenopodium quinoa TaxID=63459 RepID=A0A803MRG7_CHEQI|nr:transient receptor potential cation channel subfamily A member 1-like [Chenopodium quinoa]
MEITLSILLRNTGTLKFITEALKILPASVDRIKLICGKNTEGDTPLHMAAKLQTKEIAEHLISSYEDLCVVDDAEQEITLLWRVHNNQGNAPLHVALMNGGKSIQVAFYLFCVGPEVAACTNHRNETPLHLAVMYDNQGAKMSTINMINKLNGQGASLTFMKNLFEEDSLSLIKFLLEENSTVCCFHDANGMTPLLRATINSYLPVVEAIISSCRESIEICDFKGRNILHHIKFSSFIKANKFLRISGVSVLLDQQDDDGNTPVHIAAQNHDFGMIKAMIESNDNFAIKNNEGISAASIIQSDSNFSTT